MASIRKRPGRPKPYEARYWAPGGQQRSRSFKRKGDAERWLATQTADLARGTWVMRESGSLNRNYFNQHIWMPALREAGVPDTRENGMHALRHYFASVLLEGGVSIRAVAAYLGHADPGFTLRTYTHLMPTAEDRVREAIEDALARAGDPVDVYGGGGPAGNGDHFG